MGYINTGTARSLKVSVDKKVGGNQAQGYPKTYDGQQSWGNASYPTLTDTQVRQLSDTDFNTRYEAFVAYVESVENGLDFDTDIAGDGATKYDLTLCGTTTTTTEAPVSVYAFSVQHGKYPVDVCGGTNDVVYSSSSYPVVGTILYKDINLTQPWNVTNGEHIRFMSPVLHGQNAVNVSLTTGKILSITSFNCSGIATTTSTTTTTSPPELKRLNISISDVEGLDSNDGLGGTLYLNGIAFLISTYQKLYNKSVFYGDGTSVFIQLSSIVYYKDGVAGESYYRISVDGGVTWSSDVSSAWVNMTEDKIVLVEVKSTSFTS